MNLSAPKPLLIIPFAFALLVFTAFPGAAARADDIPPPPDVQDTDASSRSGSDHPVQGEQAPNLQKELSAPKKGEEVDVRSYMRKDGAHISEYSSHGHVYMIKVQPAGGLPAYYLYDDNGDGEFDRRLPGGYKRISPPSWVIKRF
ncbi:MAG TPA: DUF2782 domain-containing protein [Mariprofundaceae bacterium]|nr:DUF2782 domain-containing protein [Mariprofundaceae bacterium]